MTIAATAAVSAWANPVGPVVTQGSASFNSAGSHMTIQTSDRAFINWQSFNIAAGQTTTFVQPSANSLVWNHINGASPSQILGNLNANGYVVLQNSAGFYVGGQASITAHGVIMTTSPIAVPDLTSGGAWDFGAPPPSSSVINYGQINLSRGGALYLIADNIENHGTLSAPGGDVGLYSGKEVLISQQPDGLGLSAKVTMPAGSVDNDGHIIADAGTIAMNAKVVNQGGLVQANSVADVNGVIELVAGDAVNLGANSVISAQGGAQGMSAGGSVVIKSGNTFSDQASSVINVGGGAQGGNGGQAEISAPQISSIQSIINGKAAPGFVDGELTIDPLNILLTTPGTQAPASGTVGVSDPPAAGTLTLDVNSFSSSLSQINLQAANNIELNTTWELNNSAVPATLTLTAGNKITLDTGSSIQAGNNWTVNMFAGPNNLASKPASGTDGIYLNGTGFIQTENGNINLWAANEVLVATSGALANGIGNGIRTLGGGNITVTAQYGNVNTGADPLGFLYRSSAPYYSVNSDVGGISTAAGGNVTINAGGNITSFLPSSGTAGAADAGTGAFGSQPGNVTLQAGGNIVGHYVLANGVGTVTAENNVGSSLGGPNSFALSLIKGSWTVNAPNGSIYLQEVRNPNGVFNTAGGAGAAGRHLFNYDPESSVALNAGIGVFLTDVNVPRLSGNAVPVIYPPNLSITAGAGGVTLQDNVTLFPSPYAGLDITTSGNLVSAPNNPGATPELLMSDSSATRWANSATFGDLDHGTTPLEVGNPNPVTITVSGNMENLTLITTKATDIKVGGDMINCGFSGQNLHASDVTSITVGGQIFNQSPITFISLNQLIPGIPAADLPPNLSDTWDAIFNLLVNPQELATLTPPSQVLPINGGPISPAGYAAYALGAAAEFPAPINVSANPGFVYNARTGQLGFAGPMSQPVLQFLEQPLTVLRYDANGIPVLDASGHFVTDTINWVGAAQIASLYQLTQGAPNPQNPALGYRLGGPGAFDIQAGSISLGNTYGILAEGAGDTQGGFGRYANLAPYTARGADLNVTVNGNLEMLTSTIASLGGGNVNVTSVGGSMDLGAQEFEDLFNTHPQPSFAQGLLGRQVGFGVFSSGGGDVNVTALGDVNIDGSRIATYNGGTLTVESLQGDVNAGIGGAFPTGVAVNYVNPATGAAGNYQEQVFGSGIVATTLVNSDEVPGSAQVPGDIVVSTPRGNIIASLGGILQEALNGDVSAGPTVTLTAGSPGFVGNIDLGESGVIGGTVNVTANGNVTGLVISRQNSTINAGQSFSGTVLSGGSASLSASSVSGTIIGVTSVSVSGNSSGATVLSQNANVNGATSSTLGTSASGTSAASSAANTASSDTQQQVALNNTTSDDDEKKKHGKAPVLTKRVSRVRVILPPA